MAVPEPVQAPWNGSTIASAHWPSQRPVSPDYHLSCYLSPDMTSTQRLMVTIECEQG